MGFIKTFYVFIDVVPLPSGQCQGLSKACVCVCVSLPCVCEIVYKLCVCVWCVCEEVSKDVCVRQTERRKLTL